MVAIMKRRIKSIRLTDGKMLFYPSDDEWNKLYDQIEKVEIEESYSKEEWEAKFIVVRMGDETAQITTG